MANIFDISRYILSQFRYGISTVKLQKLAFFSQAWSLALRDKPLFDEDFQAWRFGPVSRDLYRVHSRVPGVEYETFTYGNENRLSEAEKAVVDAVIQNYGALSGPELSGITHNAGSPWEQIRTSHGLGPNDPSDLVIPKDAIGLFYRQELLDALRSEPQPAWAY